MGYVIKEYFTNYFLHMSGAVRPWQHVLDVLSGYLMLAEKLWENKLEYSGGWNFGPGESDAKSVLWIV